VNHKRPRKRGTPKCYENTLPPHPWDTHYQFFKKQTFREWELEKGCRDPGAQEERVVPPEHLDVRAYAWHAILGTH